MNYLLVVFLFFTLFISPVSAQIKYFESDTPQISGKVYSLEEGRIIVFNHKYSPIVEEGVSSLLELTNDLEIVKTVEFTRPEYEQVTFLHIDILPNKNYNLIFQNISYPSLRRTIYSGILSADWNNMDVVDSLHIGTLETTSFIPTEYAEMLKCYLSLTGSNGGSTTFELEIDKNTGHFDNFKPNIFYINDEAEQPSYIGGYGYFEGNDYLTNDATVYKKGRTASDSTILYDICWATPDNPWGRIGSLDIAFSPDGFLTMGGVAWSDNAIFKHFVIGQTYNNNLVPIYCENEPETIFQIEDYSYSGFSNSIAQDPNSKEVWGFGSSSHPIFLKQITPDFPTKIYVFKFSKKGPLIFQREISMEKHAAVFDGVVLSDGGLVLVGNYFDYEVLNEQRGFVMKLTQDGELLPTLTEDVGIHNEIAVFPNPTSDQLHLSLPQQLPFESYDINIYNMLGQRVLQIHNHQAPTVNVENLANGVYILSVTTKEDRSYYTKFEKL